MQQKPDVAFSQTGRLTDLFVFQSAVEFQADHFLLILWQVVDQPRDMIVVFGGRQIASGIGLDWCAVGFGNGSSNRHASFLAMAVDG